MFKCQTDDHRKNITGRKMRSLRLQNRVSQRVVADGLGVLGLDIDKNAVQRMESGQRFITDIEIIFIARYFKVSVNELLGLNN